MCFRTLKVCYGYGGGMTVSGTTPPSGMGEAFARQLEVYLESVAACLAVHILWYSYMGRCQTLILVVLVSVDQF